MGEKFLNMYQYLEIYRNPDLAFYRKGKTDKDDTIYVKRPDKKTECFPTIKEHKYLRNDYPDLNTINHIYLSEHSLPLHGLIYQSKINVNYQTTYN